MKSGATNAARELMSPKVLIIGGGIAGMSLAIALRRRNFMVDLVEIDPDWRVYGAGLSISGATLRALDQLGVLDSVLKHGYWHEGFEVYDTEGRCISVMRSPHMPDTNIYGGAAIMRPVLKDILSKVTLEMGTTVRLGVTFISMTQGTEKVEVSFSDGSSGCYDLVIGADGLMSKVRAALFPQAPQPKYTGQGCWRAVFPRPADITRMRLYVGTPYKIGVNPVSEHEMYMFLLESRATKQWIADEQLHVSLREMLSSCGGVLRTLGESLNANSRIMFRPLESLFMPRPWYQGRVLLIGDASHATTPHLASGAGLAIEDALVLAQELDTSRSIEDALQVFTERRHERCRLVIENSLRLGDIEQNTGSLEEHRQLMRDSMEALAAPI